ncbi:Uncharacterised protein [Slackia heliotrinireducens]|uniref:Uncharacterized protein n=1 Tax=Slackia heliotrinireducens (strain ATCC 29202 / DSM 20476 / NCTC 11029 / RHS 1) TaxID=471855 RepID=C7N6P4_SLAHD|nr:hypothetical protein [Slackia heliotrinireducens]ACV22579.1 hypothetical protein Shel_15600 [Slackia heliotrinireducens DSM 20476]VEH01067.1 Uncharacterised protein [Slackia heliotrinireducens]
MPAKDYKAYVSALNNASLLAQRDLSAVWERVEGMPPDGARDALLALVPGIVYRYGRMAALAAAQYYEAERLQAGGPEGFSAEVSDGVPMEQIEASVRFACGHLFPGDGDGTQPEQDGGLFGGQGRRVREVPGARHD